MTEVKEATLVMAVADLSEGLGHLEGQVDKELLGRPEGQAEEDPEGHRGRLEADHLEDLVDNLSRLRPCTILIRMVCSTSHRRLGTWLRNRGWRFR